MLANSKLLSRWNTNAPRYTSYPTILQWQNMLEQEEWADEVQFTFNHLTLDDSISLYIHLPYCESLCTYCGCNKHITINHAVEEPYIDAVLKEWNMYRNLFDRSPVIRELHLGGGTPTFFSPKNLSRLVEQIFCTATRHPESILSIEVHPGNTTLEHLQTLYSIGFRRISIGVQDFDPVVQKAINRVQTFECVRMVTQNARRIGFHSVNFDLIYGLPKQNKEGLSKTFHLTQQLRPNRIAFYSYAHVPWVKPSQRSFTEGDLPNTKEKIALYEHGRSLLEKYGYLEIGMDHFSLPDDDLNIAATEHKLHRNFMGYTTAPSKLLIGLGVSAISDTWLAYIQNEKTIKLYLKAIHSNQFPIFRAHLQRTEDILIRKHILDLMCNYSTKWYNPTSNRNLYKVVRERLSQHVNDGLVEINDEGILVTNIGKTFLRNICTAFDQRLYATPSKENLFSRVV